MESPAATAVLRLLVEPEATSGDNLICAIHDLREQIEARGPAVAIDTQLLNVLRKVSANAAGDSGGSKLKGPLLLR